MNLSPRQLSSPNLADVVVVLSAVAAIAIFAVILTSAKTTGEERSRVLERATAQTWGRVMRIALSIGLPFTILATWLRLRW